MADYNAIDKYIFHMHVLSNNHTISSYFFNLKEKKCVQTFFIKTWLYLKYIGLEFCYKSD